MRLLLFLLLFAQVVHAADVDRGKTFSSDDSVTNTKLHQLVDSATVTNITQTDIKVNEALILKSTSAPTDTDQIWIDTNFTPPLLKKYDGSNWIHITGLVARLTNKSGGGVVAGDVVIADTTTDDSFKTTTSQGDSTVIGVSLETIANDAAGLVALRGGPWVVNVNGTVSHGDFLITKTTATKAEATSSVRSGIFGIATSSNASGDGTVNALLINSSGASSATPGLTLSTSNAEGSAVTFLRTDATVLVFDATNPSTQDFSDSPAVGAASVAARRDHSHGMPATPAYSDNLPPFYFTGTKSGTGMANMDEISLDGGTIPSGYYIYKPAALDNFDARLRNYGASCSDGGDPDFQIKIGTTTCAEMVNVNCTNTWTNMSTCDISGESTGWLQVMVQMEEEGSTTQNVEIEGVLLP